MARLLLHAISAMPDVDVDVPEIDGRSVKRVDVDMLATWVSEWDERSPAFGRAHLAEHHSIVVAIWRAVACLPVRFPTWFGGADSLRPAIVSRATDLRATLEQVVGRAELAVTVLWVDSAEPDPVAGDELPTSPGRRYIEQRRRVAAAATRRETAAQEIAARLEAALESFGVAVRHTISPSEQVALSSAVLVRAENFEAVRVAISDASERWPGARVLINGPWPPYSFATIDRLLSGAGGSSPVESPR